MHRAQRFLLATSRRMFGDRLPYRPVGRWMERAGLLTGEYEARIATATVALDLRQPIQRQIFFGGAPRFEPPTSDILRGWLADADAFFDIGANFGFYSYIALSARPDLTVYAFEPHPRLVAQITANRDRNWASERLVVAPTALGDARGTARFAVQDHGLEAGTLTNHSGMRGQQIHVPVVPLDEWLAENGVVVPAQPQWVLKIDVEGWEVHVLRGMAGVFATGAVKALVVELNEYTLNLAGSSSEEVRGLLAEHGFVERVRVDGCINGFFELQDS